MTLFITLVLRLALPLMLPWVLCVIALCSGELKSALHLAGDGLLAPFRLLTAFLRPRPQSLVDLRLQQPTMSWRPS